MQRYQEIVADVIRLITFQWQTGRQAGEIRGQEDRREQGAWRRRAQRQGGDRSRP